MINIGEEKKHVNKAIKYRSIQARNLYMVNNHIPYTDKEGNQIESRLIVNWAVMNDCIFLQRMGSSITTRRSDRRTEDLVELKFDYDIKNIKTAAELREYYYINGVEIEWTYYDKDGNVTYKMDKIKYKMLMRSPGKAKKGYCIFIKESLYKKAINCSSMQLINKLDKDNAKIVELAAYQTMITATATDYIHIPMENILIVKDLDVSTMARAVAVKTKTVKYKWKDIEPYINKRGYTVIKKTNKAHPELKLLEKTLVAIEAHDDLKDYPKEKTECYVDRSSEKREVSNTLWDGMGLIDESIFPDDMNGFIYCRSHFFKSCLFRGNIQQFFKELYGEEYDTAVVYDMFGNAFLVKDIKVIVTENSIKWIKFADIMSRRGTDRAAYKYYKKFMKNDGEQFTIVKTGHPSKYGDYQRSSYQMNNSLPTTDREVLERVAQTSIDYCNDLKTDHNAFIRHLRSTSQAYKINDMLIALDERNSDFKHTDYFLEHQSDIISKFKTNELMLGKLLQEGDNLTICGNPLALMMYVTCEDRDKFDPYSEGCFQTADDVIECYTERFSEGECLAGFRNPHNAPNNIVHLMNVYPEMLRRYFPKLGRNVIVINGIGTDVQDRLNSQDLDSDFVYVTNQPDIVNLAREAYLNYPTIINDIPLKGNSTYGNDLASYAKMDNTIAASQLGTGYGSDIAQLALSYYYDCSLADRFYCVEDKVHEIKKRKLYENIKRQLEDTFIICSVLAQVSIDSAKRIFDIDIGSELVRLTKLDCMNPAQIYPNFFAENQKRKNKKEKKSDRKKLVKDNIRKYECPMDILAAIVGAGIADKAREKRGKFKNLFNAECEEKYNLFSGDAKENPRRDKQYKRILQIVKQYNSDMNDLNRADEDYKEQAQSIYLSCQNEMKKRKVKQKVMMILIRDALDGKIKDDDFRNRVGYEQFSRGIRDRLLITLYGYDKDAFLECFVKKEQENDKTII